MTRTIRLVLSSLALLFAADFASAQSNEISNTAVQRATRYMDAADRGKACVLFLHFGQQYVSHANDGKVYTVKDSSTGRVKPGEFALKYTFQWGNDGGETTLTCFFTPSGSFISSSMTYTNATLNRPFLLANASIQILGNAILEAKKDDMSAADRRDLQRMVDDADAHAMMNWLLKLGSSVNR